MKKFISLALSLLMLISCIPFVAFADEAIIISGSYIVPSDGADILSVDGIDIASGADVEFEMIINVDDVSSTYSNIYLNNKKVAALVNGENIIKIKTSDLKEGENEVKLMLGIGTKTYAITDVYGTYNIDDIVVAGVSFNGISIEKPSKTKFYMPKEGASGVSIEYAEYSENITVGDGWDADTGFGGNTPDVPVSVGFIFEKPNLNDFFVFDTTKVPDGEHTASLTKGDSVVKTIKYIVDNTAPEIVFSVPNGAKVSRLDAISYVINDITNVKSNFYIDGKPVKSVLAKDLSLGNHTAFVVAYDEAGNCSQSMITFDIVDKTMRLLLTVKILQCLFWEMLTFIR